MKTELNIEESARLIELGVDAKLASKCQSAVKVCASGRGIIRLPESRPIFTLSDLLLILPKEIDEYYLNMSAYMAEWCVSYERIDCCDNFVIKCSRSAPELIDALNLLLIWAITNGHVNTDKK